MQTIHKSKKNLIFAAGTVVLLLAIATVAAYSFKSWPFAHQTSDVQTQQEAANASDTTNPQHKIDIPSQEESNKNGSNKTTDEVPIATGSTLTITKLIQDDSGITYSGAVQGSFDSGTCSALFEHTNGAARPITRVTPSTSDGCPNTTIPQAEFVARGTWKLTLRYYTNDKQLITSKEIEVQ